MCLRKIITLKRASSPFGVKERYVSIVLMRLLRRPAEVQSMFKKQPSSGRTYFINTAGATPRTVNLWLLSLKNGPVESFHQTRTKPPCFDLYSSCRLSSPKMKSQINLLTQMMASLLLFDVKTYGYITVVASGLLRPRQRVLLCVWINYVPTDSTGVNFA